MKTNDKMKHGIVIAALALLGLQTATAKDNNTATYEGPQISLEQHRVTARRLCDLEGFNVDGKYKGLSFQGMAIWQNLLVSLQNTGYCTVYDFDGSKVKKRGTFKLGSFGETNHANVASFGCQYAVLGDKLPLLYVTRCNGSLQNGMDKLLYVERVDPDGLKSELVQKIWFNDVKKNYLATTQFVVDRKAGMLYAFGNSNSADPKKNTHPVFKFRLPEYNGPQDSLVVLTEEDALDRFTVEDFHVEKVFHIGQGAWADNGIIYFPCGVGSATSPNRLFVLDANSHWMRNVIDLSGITQNEPEDCDYYDGDLIMQVQKGLYRLHFE